MNAERNHDIELIQKSLTGELTSEERKEYEEKSVDDSFQKEIKFQKDMLSIIHNEEHNRLKNILIDEEKRISSEIKKKQPGRVRSISWKPLSIAAALIIITGFLFLLQPDSQSEKLYAEHFSDYPNLLEITARSSETTTERQVVMSLYDNENYDDALMQYQNSNDLKGDPDVSFYMAIAMMNTADYEAARLILENLKSDNQHNFMSQINWYLSLLYIKVNDRNSALKILSEILENPEHYKIEEAELIFETLND